MILVTVGTTMPFDTLIMAVDDLCRKGTILEPVLCQIGQGKYEPEHCEFVRFLPHIDDEINRASLVIGHGGTGTTLELLLRGKKFISVANPMAADAHQERFLERLGKEVELIWTKETSDLERLISDASELGVRASNIPCLVPSLAKFIDAISAGGINRD